MNCHEHGFILPFSYFHISAKDQEPLKWQLGVVRTNCMDNLDRTNVAQAAIARWVLDLQLKAAGVVAEKDVLDQHEEIDVALRESTKRIFTLRFSHADIDVSVWSDHADLISKAYAGSGALKTDFTRTGKRTRQGAFDDFKKSVFRYIRNNYFDGARQVRVGNVWCDLMHLSLERTRTIL
jgi:phosphatidylinositol 4-phosphatase